MISASCYSVFNHIGGVLANVLASSVIHRGCRYNYISGVLASVLASSVIHRGCRYNYIGGVLASVLASCLIKTECHDITEIFLKVAFNTINQPPKKITQKKKNCIKNSPKKCTKNTYEK